jgi:hypothetical protein
MEPVATHAARPSGPYDAAMPLDPETLMTFPTLDDAESAVDWIGLDVTEGDGWFAGVLDEDAAELCAAAVADDETPQPVRALAVALLDRWRARKAPQVWQITFPG